MQGCLYGSLKGEKKLAPELQKVQKYLAGFGLADRVKELDQTSATAQQAAQALQVGPGCIAKTISLKKGDGCVLIVTSGDRKIDNAKFKHTFGLRAKLLSTNEVLPLTGYPIGSVCPFCCADTAQVWLDVSLRRFSRVYPAAGTSNSVAALTCAELERAGHSTGWVDVCKPMTPRKEGTVQ
ncbi:YbaK/EbsC family protein [Caproicibacterium lactatifermentans]|jgi:prolyl-tRNA editing enzyme YbaK/EbsC (Cys-tRNA(Pro) deacylase)|uniref:YbaK/EbsC family protein n=1 Tax=Caproicibacterium lactatifermentans TaxID=2666138 RepID=A0A859DPL9_9FIRM|nr:YbaK/EbsC family protein [Caproicibacterium lactatifermentans]QKO29586.1 YbaK/EbsC family protein [Caproicibacterium lactatifermentans]